MPAATAPHHQPRRTPHTHRHQSSSILWRRDRHLNCRTHRQTVELTAKVSNSKSLRGRDPSTVPPQEPGGSPGPAGGGADRRLRVTDQGRQTRRRRAKNPPTVAQDAHPAGQVFDGGQGTAGPRGAGCGPATAGTPADNTTDRPRLVRGAHDERPNRWCYPFRAVVWQDQTLPIVVRLLRSRSWLGWPGVGRGVAQGQEGCVMNQAGDAAGAAGRSLSRAWNALF